MALQPRIIACGTKMALIGMAIRFVGGPLLMSTASFVVGMRGTHLRAAIVQVPKRLGFMTIPSNKIQFNVTLYM